MSFPIPIPIKKGADGSSTSSFSPNLHSLPAGPLSHLFHFVEDTDLHTLSHVSKSLNIHSRDPILWKYIHTTRNSLRLQKKLTSPQRLSKLDLMHRGIFKSVDSRVFEVQSQLSKLMIRDRVRKGLQTRPSAVELR